MLVKYTSPTMFDEHEYKTVWHNTDDNTMWIQSSVDKSQPKWIRLGEFLEATHSIWIDDELFLKQTMDLYQKLQVKENE